MYIRRCCSSRVNISICGFVPETVTNIKSRAYQLCKSLESVTILNPECQIESDAFSYFSGCIYGYSNSTAQRFAEEKNLAFISLGEAPIKEIALGDSNGDGIINAVDASRILVLYAGLSSGEAEATDKDFAACDINGDKLINAVDASLVLAYYASLAQSPDLTLEAFLEERK